MESIMSRQQQKSSLNPNAAPFIPASYQAVEDFSTEWWDLVQNAGWYRDYWLSQQNQQQQQEDIDTDTDTFFGTTHQEESKFDEDDIANLLPSSLDLGFDEEDYIMDHHHAQPKTNFRSFSIPPPPQQEKYVEPGVGALMKSLSLSPSARGGMGRYSKSTMGGGGAIEPMKKYYYHDKVAVAAAAAQCASPKSVGGAWRIYQPR